jgi:hypothetical protein
MMEMISQITSPTGRDHSITTSAVSGKFQLPSLRDSLVPFPSGDFPGDCQ